MNTSIKFDHKIYYFFALSTALALTGCPKDHGQAIRETCSVNDDCINIQGVLCLPATPGETFSDFCSTTVEEGLTVKCDTTTNDQDKGVPKICDVDEDGDGIADVIVRDKFIYGLSANCGGDFGSSSALTCGELDITGLGAQAPCDAYPGLIDYDGYCYPPRSNNNNNNNNNNNIDAGVSGNPSDSGTNNNPVDSGTNNNPVDSGVPPGPTDSGVPPGPADSGVPPGPVDSGVPPGPISCNDVYLCFLTCIDSATNNASLQSCQTNCRRNESSNTRRLFNNLYNCATNNRCSITLGASNDYSTCVDNSCLFEVDECLAN